MNAKEIARQLELIKYFTLKKSPIHLNINANVDLNEEIINEYVQLSGNFSFTFESIIVDYAKSYSSDLKEKTLQIFFYKKPNENSDSFELIDNPNGLMTPAIINNYIKDEQNFKRYIFPSMYNYQTYSEWYSDTAMNIDERDTRSYAMNIIVQESSSEAFESFLNETYAQWQSRFTTAKDLAKNGDFDWFCLYDSRIYKYELSFEDRKIILNKLVHSTDWFLTFDFLSDKYELFISLINNINENDGATLYNYMFEIDLSTGKSNLQVYEDKIPTKLYDELIKILMKLFYFTYITKEDGINELREGFREYLLYPIGFLEKPTWEMGNFTYFDLEKEEEKGTGLFRLGIKYDIKLTNLFNVNIKSAVQYRYNYFSNLNRIEFKNYDLVGNGIEWKFNDVIYITPFLSNQKLSGLDIPFGSVIPIPAFALPWLVSQNEDTKNIINLIEKVATIVGVVFPLFEIFEGINILYNVIGLGFTLLGNALDNGLVDQIKRYDESKSTSTHQYKKGSDFLEVYYLLSTIYGGISLGKAISTAENKIKVLIEFETLLDMEGIVGDISSFMTEYYPEENIDSLNTIKNEMEQLQIDYNKYKFFKNRN